MQPKESQETRRREGKSKRNSEAPRSTLLKLDASRAQTNSHGTSSLLGGSPGQLRPLPPPDDAADPHGRPAPALAYDVQGLGPRANLRLPLCLQACRSGICHFSLVCLLMWPQSHAYRKHLPKSGASSDRDCSLARSRALTS